MSFWVQTTGAEIYQARPECSIHFMKWDYCEE